MAPVHITQVNIFRKMRISKCFQGNNTILKNGSRLLVSCPDVYEFSVTPYVIREAKFFNYRIISHDSETILHCRFQQITLSFKKRKGMVFYIKMGQAIHL